MKEQNRRVVDKSAWGDGPWMGEPDRESWKDKATGLPCLLQRGPSGSWCGYAGVTEAHPLFGKHYGKCARTPPCEEGWCDHRPEYALEAHGGITFAGERTAPEVTGEAKVWWFGFDCAHLGDYSPAFDGLRINSEWGSVYRDRDYVRGEVARLSAQLAKAGGAA